MSTSITLTGRSTPASAPTQPAAVQGIPREALLERSLRDPAYRAVAGKR